MAQRNGGGPRSPPPPRVHRGLDHRQAIAMSSLDGGASLMPSSSSSPAIVTLPLTAPLAPLLQQRPVPQVSLVAPRPERERSANEYVETPFLRSPMSSAASSEGFPSSLSPPLPTTPSSLTPPPHPPRHLRPTGRTPMPSPGASPASAPLSPVVFKQPRLTKSSSSTIGTSPIVTFSKDAGVGTSLDGGLAECSIRPSIVCPECSRCRCATCQQPRPLPKCWVCSQNCLLSGDSIVDYASCLCCVKGFFYHCAESDTDSDMADNPCSCGPNRRRARWGCLAAFSFVLPCLWLYWPLRGCRYAVEACYSKHSRAGCRCRPTLVGPSTVPSAQLMGSATTTTTNTTTTTEKRLLDASTMPDF